MDNAVLGPSIRIPDSITPIRAWKGLMKTSGGRFVSPQIRGSSWILGQTNKAICPVGRHFDGETLSWITHGVPAEGCTCGFYALKSPGFRFWRWLMLNTWGIPSRVELYGKVIEHERGYRAEYARLIRVYPSARWIIRSCFFWPSLIVNLVYQQWWVLLINLGVMGVYNVFMLWSDQRQARRGL